MSLSDGSSKPVEIFYSYSHKDEKLRNKLETHLSLLKRQGLVINWHDRKISAGKEWQKEINLYINTAHIILLLVSPDFLASEFCYSIEMKRAVERHERGEARVIPIILRPVYWHNVLFGKLQALPTDAKPVTGSTWRNQDEAFFNVAEGIRKVVEEFRGGSDNNDEFFADFLSNKEFIHDVEVLFADVQANIERNERPPYEKISLIAINIDHLNKLANTYRESFLIDLCRAVGLRIKDEFSSLVNPKYSSLYHINTGRFYMILKNISLEEVREKANQLRQSLNGEYHIGPNDLFVIPNVTVHLGVTSYTYSKLAEIVQWYPIDASKEEASKIIVRELEKASRLGNSAGGNVVISWDTRVWGYIRYDGNDLVNHPIASDVDTLNPASSVFSPQAAILDEAERTAKHIPNQELPKESTKLLQQQIKTYYIFEDKPIGYARIHFSNCRYCNDGKGIQPNVGGANSKWYGPFNTIQIAEEAAHKTGKKVDKCKICNPG